MEETIGFPSTWLPCTPVHWFDSCWASSWIRWCISIRVHQQQWGVAGCPGWKKGFLCPPSRTNNPLRYVDTLRTHTYALGKADSVECLCYIVQKRKKNNHVSFHLCTAFVRCSSYLGDTEDPKHLTPALCIVKLLSTSTHMPSDTYIYLSI